jgi:hypothetical protein
VGYEVKINLDEFISNHDLAALADWAGKQKQVAQSELKRPYALIREGADTLLRQRALSERNEHAEELNKIYQSHHRVPIEIKNGDQVCK